MGMQEGIADFWFRVKRNKPFAEMEYGRCASTT